MIDIPESRVHRQADLIGVLGVALGRITSYNVCYTKLLRAILEAAIPASRKDGNRRK